MNKKFVYILIKYSFLFVFILITGLALYVYWYFFLMLLVLYCSLFFSWKIYDLFSETFKKSNLAHISINIVLPIILTITLLTSIYKILPPSLQDEIKSLKNIRLDTKTNLEDINV